MALVLQDRVSVNSTGSGTGNLALGSAYPGFRTFSSCIPDGSIVYYAISNQAVGSDTEWEVGYGKYVLGTDTLVRNNGNAAETGVYSSSNSNTYVNFTAGTNGLQIFITQPSEQAVYQDVDGTTTFPEGIISVVGANATAPSFATTLSSFVSNVPSFSQMVLQNQSADANASSDIVAYNNLGDGSSYFVDMGINSSAYNSADYPIFPENSAYVFSGGDIAGTGAAGETSDLYVGTSTANSNVVIFGGSVNVGAEIATFAASTKNVNFANGISATGNVSANNVNITNFAYSGANLAAAANNTVLVTKEYVDNATSNGFHVHTPVLVATTGNLTATYNNGTAGVGATLTNSGAQAALSIDGVSLSVNDRVLVWQQTTGLQNGVYVVTTVGSGATNWVLTRSSDADTSSEGDPNSLGGGDYFFVQSGTTLGYHSYICTNTSTITFGTTAITFSEFSSVPAYIGTAPINVSGQTIALTGIVPTANGGTNLSSYTTGDTLYSNATNSLAKLAIGSQYNVLSVSGSGVPHWSQVNLGSSAAVSGSLGATYGGTGQTTYTLGDIIYSDATNSLAKLAGQTTTTQKFLSQTGTGTASAAPVWDTIPAGSITGLGTMSTQNANAVAITGGTLNNVVIGGTTANAATFTTATATSFVGSGASLTSLNGSNVTTGTIANARTTATNLNTASAIVARDAGGNFTATTITANLTGTASSATTATTATTANNIAGGAAGGIPYQTGSGATSILATASGVLVGGTTPSYSTAPTLTGTNFSGIPNSATTATAANTASAIVARDASGNFTAGAITATSISGSGAALTSLNASNLASGTIPSAILGNSAVFIGTTSTALNRASANQALTGISSVTFPGSTSGTVQLIPAATAGTGTVLTMPATTGTVITSGDSATVTNTMLAGSIANAKLANSSTTINGTAIALGSSGTITAANPNALTIGTGLSGTSYNGSAAVTIANTGVTSATAGTGISVSAATGGVTFTNSGVTSIVAGSGISISGATGAVTITSSVTSPIPAGTVMLFYQAAAPTGWTQVTTQNNKDIRVVSGTGGGTGGTTAYTSVFTNQTPSFTGSNGTLAVTAGTLGVGTGTLAVSATTLSTAQMPSHTHTYDKAAGGSGGSCGGDFNSYFTANTGSAGSSGSHTHSLSGAPTISGAPALSGTISGTNGAITLNVQYIDVIICSKN